MFLPGRAAPFDSVMPLARAKRLMPCRSQVEGRRSITRCEVMSRSSGTTWLSTRGSCSRRNESIRKTRNMIWRWRLSTSRLTTLRHTRSACANCSVCVTMKVFEAVAWIKTLPPTILAKRTVPLNVAETFMATNDWDGLRKFCAGTKWDALDYMRNALAARALREVGQVQESSQDWKEAVAKVGTR